MCPLYVIYLHTWTCAEKEHKFTGIKIKFMTLSPSWWALLIWMQAFLPVEIEQESWYAIGADNNNDNKCSCFLVHQLLIMEQKRWTCSDGSTRPGHCSRIIWMAIPFAPLASPISHTWSDWWLMLMWQLPCPRDHNLGDRGSVKATILRNQCHHLFIMARNG